MAQELVLPKSCLASLTTAARRTLLVATDGLLAYSRLTDMRRIAQEGDLDAAAQALMHLVRLPSGELADDAVLVLLRSG